MKGLYILETKSSPRTFSYKPSHDSSENEEQQGGIYPESSTTLRAQFVGVAA